MIIKSLFLNVLAMLFTMYNLVRNAFMRKPALANNKNLDQPAHLGSLFTWYTSCNFYNQFAKPLAYFCS